MYHEWHASRSQLSHHLQAWESGLLLGSVTKLKSLSLGYTPQPTYLPVCIIQLNRVWKAVVISATETHVELMHCHHAMISNRHFISCIHLLHQVHTRDVCQNEFWSMCVTRDTVPTLHFLYYHRVPGFDMARWLCTVMRHIWPARGITTGAAHRMFGCFRSWSEFCHENTLLYFWGDNGINNCRYHSSSGSTHAAETVTVLQSQWSKKADHSETSGSMSHLSRSGQVPWYSTQEAQGKIGWVRRDIGTVS